MKIELLFPDKCVTYETFIEDLALSLVPKLEKVITNPRDVISQRQAYNLYGFGNVKRWRKKNLLTPFSIRPGKIEYKVSDLDILKNRFQDYFN